MPHPARLAPEAEFCPKFAPMKPSLPKGTRDFLPAEMRKRHYLFGVLRDAFEDYGYAPIETPAMENLSTLTGKYGEEGDQLLFKVLNNGDFLGRADAAALDARDSAAAVSSLSKRGLRYDLTVPFARYVVQRRNDLTLPFKRYAIQPVWRADRPQKGRYQEFYQCDADVVGSESLLYEAELLLLFRRAFEQLGLAVVVKVNHRGVLQGLLEVAGAREDQFVDFVTSLDKLDKIGRERVVAEMVARGLDGAAAERAFELLEDETLLATDGPLAASEAGAAALAEVARVRSFVSASGVNADQAMTLAPTLARGLSYYTGCIFEVEVDTSVLAQADIRMGSIAAGGRYANLTEAFGGRGMSGVGISFGAERIYDVLEELNAWPEAVTVGRQVLLAAFDEESLAYAFAKTQELRAAGIRADCYPEPAKPKKSLGYADSCGIPYAVLIGERERESGRLALKDLGTGEQESLGMAEVIERLT